MIESRGCDPGRALCPNPARAMGSMVLVVPANRITRPSGSSRIITPGPYQVLITPRRLS